MTYYKINYDNLKRLPQIKYYKVIILLIILVGVLIIPANKYTITKKLSIYGQVKDSYIELEISNKLSDKLIKNSQLKFNGRDMSYKIVEFKEPEIINNQIYQKVVLAVDEKVYQDEIGLVTINYDEQKIIKYIFELFK